MSNSEIKELILKKYGKEQLRVFATVYSNVLREQVGEDNTTDIAYDAIYWGELSVELISEELNKMLVND
jgi:hypothetical protein